MRPLRASIAISFVVIPLAYASACGDATFEASGTDAGLLDADAIADSANDSTEPLFDAGLDGVAPPLVTVGNTKVSFGIGATEVTVAQYRRFYDEVPTLPPSAIPAGCTQTTPSLTPSGPDDFPATSVTWCDAYAFCAWAGERLCGAIDGGSLPVGEANNPVRDQWFFACSGDNTDAFDYAQTPEAGVCNVGEDGGALAAVASFPGCVGKFRGIYDMIGNAGEWYDLRSAEDGGVVAIQWPYRNTFFATPLSSGDCSVINGTPSSNLPDVGFRCCSNP